MAEGTWYTADIDRVIVTEEQIKEKTEHLAKQVAADYATTESVLLVGVLKGALMFMADFARALGRHGPPVELEFMAVSSYGKGTTSSGVVRIIKDLDRDIAGRHVIVVEDIVDSGLTLSWLLKYLASRSAASIEVVALLRKPDAVKVDVAVPTYETGDVWARTMVRMREAREAARLIARTMDGIPAGPARVELPPLREGDQTSAVESWRGPVWYWVMAGGPEQVERVKIADPSFRNWPALEYAVLNNIVPDFPLCNKSFNLSYSGSDL